MSSYNCLLIVVCLLLTTTKHSFSNAWTVNFNPTNETTIHMHQTVPINVTLTGLDGLDLVNNNATVNFFSDAAILKVSQQISNDAISDASWTGELNISGIFLGTAKVFAEIVTKHDEVQISNETLTVTIIREEKLIDKIFNVSVAVLVSILYINFGAALDLGKIKDIIVRPIGPSIAIFCNFLFMPLLSYFLGLLLFPNNVAMQLGLFFTGVSPSGGASNIWSVILGGNLDLSISMTTISTFSAFAIMPLWLFTLGPSIFHRGELTVPYHKIGMYAVCLIVPLGIGILIQRRWPKLAKILVRILKSCSSLLIVFIIVFAIVTNLYLFELFTWQILVAGLGLPWIAYIVGWIISASLRQKHEDCIAISLEAGIQNTGIAIFLLRFALGQPQADLTTVIPVSVAIMTPFPLLFYYLYLKGKDRFSKHRHGVIAVPSDESKSIAIETPSK